MPKYKQSTCFRRFLYGLLILTTIVLISACGGSNDSNDKASDTGKWDKMKWDAGKWS